VSDGPANKIRPIATNKQLIFFFMIFSFFWIAVSFTL